MASLRAKRGKTRKTQSREIEGAGAASSTAVKPRDKYRNSLMALVHVVNRDASSRDPQLLMTDHDRHELFHLASHGIIPQTLDEAEPIAKLYTQNLVYGNRVLHQLLADVITTIIANSRLTFMDFNRFELITEPQVVRTTAHMVGRIHVADAGAHGSSSSSSAAAAVASPVNDTDENVEEIRAPSRTRGRGIKKFTVRRAAY